MHIFYQQFKTNFRAQIKITGINKHQAKMELKNLAGKASFHLAGFLLFTARFVPVQSPAGPALLAKRLGVPIIPAYVCRDKDNFHHITILPELHLRQEDEHENS